MENSSERSSGKTPPIECNTPPAEQARLNLSVWAGTLGGGMRERQVKLLARDYRPSMTWALLLPKRCWLCDESPATQRKEFRRTLRGFSNPMGTVMLGGFAAIVLFALVIFAGHFVVWLFAFAAAAAVPVLLYVRGWDEDVKLVFFSCDRHASELECPPMALHEDYLCVFMPTPELAQRTRDMILAERRRGGRYLSDEEKAGAAAPVDPMMQPPQDAEYDTGDESRAPRREPQRERRPESNAPPPPSRSIREELPPIQLDD